jgi:hypothetical protein
LHPLESAALSRRTPKAAVPTTRSNRWSDPKLSFVARAEIGSS